MKVIIVQRIFHHYRLAFLRELAARIGAAGGSLCFLFSEVNGVDEADVPDFAARLGTWVDKPIDVKGLSDRIIVQKGLLKALRDRKPDLIIAEDIVALPSTLTISFYRLLWRCPFLIWTLGPHVVGKERSRMRAFASPLIWFVRTMAAGFISYSDWGKKRLQQDYDKPVFVAYNSIEAVKVGALERSKTEKKYETAEAKNLLYIGRLSFHKRVDVLINAVSLLGDRKWTLNVVGTGEAESSLRDLVEQLDLSDRVVFHGSIISSDKKAAIFSTSHLGVMPSLGGLFVQEAYAHGIPVIAGPADGTEFDLILDVNPALFIEKITAETLADSLRQFLDLSSAEQAQCAQRAVQIAAQKFNTQNMAAGFTQAISTVLGAANER